MHFLPFQTILSIFWKSPFLGPKKAHIMGIWAENHPFGFFSYKCLELSNSSRNGIKIQSWIVLNSIEYWKYKKTRLKMILIQILRSLVDSAGWCHILFYGDIFHSRGPNLHVNLPTEHCSKSRVECGRMNMFYFFLWMNNVLMLPHFFL